LVDLEGRMVWDIEPKHATDFNEPVVVFSDPIAETKDRTGKLSVEEPDFEKILQKVFGKSESKIHFVPSARLGYPTKGSSTKRVMIENPEEEEKKPEPITDAQIRYIHKLVKDLGWSEEKYRTWLKDLFKRESSKELTKYEATLAIEKLKEKLDQSQDDEIIL